MFGFTLCALFASSILSTVRADPVPTTPGPGDVFKQGGQCTFTWTPDTTGVWKVMNVELMTGSNFQMVHLTTVGTFDGTSPATTTHSYPCPEVTLHSAIYFYQFSSPASGNRTWTTRFAIADADGKTTPPTEKTQPGNDAPIPWGTGALVNAADAKPPPPNGGGSAPPSSGGGTASQTSTTVAPVAKTPAPTTPSPTADAQTASSTSPSAAATTSVSAAVSFNPAAGMKAFQALCAVGTVAIASVLFV